MGLLMTNSAWLLDWLRAEHAETLQRVDRSAEAVELLSHLTDGDYASILAWNARQLVDDAAELSDAIRLLSVPYGGLSPRSRQLF